jgi:hypothetical protein
MHLGLCFVLETAGKVSLMSLGVSSDVWVPSQGKPAYLTITVEVRPRQTQSRDATLISCRIDQGF